MNKETVEILQMQLSKMESQIRAAERHREDAERQLEDAQNECLRLAHVWDALNETLNEAGVTWRYVGDE